MTTIDFFRATGADQRILRDLFYDPAAPMQVNCNRLTDRIRSLCVNEDWVRHPASKKKNPTGRGLPAPFSTSFKNRVRSEVVVSTTGRRPWMGHCLTCQHGSTPRLCHRPVRNGKCWCCQHTGQRGLPDGANRRRKKAAKNTSEKPDPGKQCIWPRLDLFLVNYQVAKLWEGGIFKTTAKSKRSQTTNTVSDDASQEGEDSSTVERKVIPAASPKVANVEAESEFNFDTWYGDVHEDLPSHSGAEIPLADFRQLQAQLGSGRGRGPFASTSLVDTLLRYPVVQWTDEQVELWWKQILPVAHQLFSSGNMVEAARYQAILNICGRDHRRALSMITRGLNDAVIRQMWILLDQISHGPRQ